MLKEVEGHKLEIEKFRVPSFINKNAVIVTAIALYVLVGLSAAILMVLSDPLGAFGGIYGSGIGFTQLEVPALILSGIVAAPWIIWILFMGSQLCVSKIADLKHKSCKKLSFNESL